MALSPVQTILLSAVTSAVVSFIVSISTIEYRLHRQQSVSEEKETNEWYSEAVRHSRNVKRKWERDYEEHSDSFTSYDEMRSEMKIFARQLDNHANIGENKGVNGEVVLRLQKCASACRSLAETRTSMVHIEGWVEAGEEVKATAKEVEESASKHL